MRADIFLREKAWQYLIEQDIASLPVNSMWLAEKNGYRIMTYLEFGELTGKPIEYIVEKYDNDGFVFWSRTEKRFVICYNSDLPPEVVRWTLMHEIAHIVLEHVTPEKPVLTRIRKINYPFFEMEADGFARRVLCPSIVLHDCGAVEVPEIMRLCGISKTAAEHRSKYAKELETRGKWRTDSLETIVEAQFKAFIVSYVRRRFMWEVAAEIAA